MHQFRDAGLVLYNPDKLDRPVNSPRAVYQLSPEALHLLQAHGSTEFDRMLEKYLKGQAGLTQQYAREREVHSIPVRMPSGAKLSLSPGAHSELIRDIVETFAPIFAPGSELIYAGDTGDKSGFFNKEALASLGVELDKHGKMPDVVLYYRDRNWLLLVESVTSHGPVDGKRHSELINLFESSSAGLVYVTAFPNRAVMSRYLTSIAWETEVWVADAPTHLIHFNGQRFLGPYST
jgi:hypothetical protein